MDKRTEFVDSLKVDIPVDIPNEEELLKDLLDKKYEEYAKIYENKKNDEIKYMYFECFNKVEEDNEKAYKNLKNEVLKANLNVIETLKTLIKVLKN